jgi:hypothetical protein
MMGDSPDQFIAVKARWLLRREPGLRTGGWPARLWLRRRRPDARAGGAGRAAAFTGCDVSAGMLARGGQRWPARSAAAGAGAAGRRAHAVRRRQFDIATISAVLHHVPPAERPAVYAELGRRAEAGRPALCLRAQSPQSAGALRHRPHPDRRERHPARCQRGAARLLGSGRYELETDYLMFMPPASLPALVDRALAWLPLGRNMPWRRASP